MAQKSSNGGEVAVHISNDYGGNLKEHNANSSPPSSSTDQGSLFQRQSHGQLLNKPLSPKSGSSPSPHNYQFSPSPKPPRTPREALTSQLTFKGSVYAKPKSRFGEQPVDRSAFEDFQTQHYHTGSTDFPNENGDSLPSRRIPITPKTPLMSSPGANRDDELEEIYKKVNKKLLEKHRMVKVKALVEWVAFVLAIGFLSASLTVHRLENMTLWGFEIWKWCILVLVIFCGRLLTSWLIHILVFVIERNFLLKKKVLYFVHGLKKSAQVFLWLALILLTWVFLFHNGFKGSKRAEKIQDYVTGTLIALFIGALLWLLKTLLLKILASKFHVTAFFDRIQESVFHQYVIQTLSGPPVIELGERIGRTQSSGQLSFRNTKGKEGGKERKVIDMAKLHNMKREKVSSWNMKLLIDAARSGLTTVSNTLDETINVTEQTDKEITSEMEAIAAAYHIFRNVAQPGFKYIDKDDLLRFMLEDEVEHVLSLFEGLENGQVDRKKLTDWVVKVFNGRKALAHALIDTKTAVSKLNQLVTLILVIVVFIIWILVLEIATTKVLVLLSSQLVVVAFMFGNTCKTIFEAIVFVFVTHPFDVGDRCVVDGVQMIVEEMNILSTVFLRYDNEKICYPNSVLALKPISNFYRSPDMGDAVEFSIDFKTPVEKIGAMKENVKRYLEKNVQYWHPSHSVIVKEIENLNMIKMALYVSHTMNFQEYGEKGRRRSDLVLEMKRIFEELNIQYNLPSQEVILASFNQPASMHSVGT